ncbi:MAG: aminodeoxychorismate lyase [Verrucomicrobiaceae bacterium]|nr:aminodeoxychorismate lyase [Verrucomicrobiaceae bacterium]
MKLVKKPHFVALFVVLAALVAWVAVYKFTDYLRTPLPITEIQNLDVPKGSSFGPVLRELSARKLLDHRILLQIYARISARGNRIQAGEYLLGPGTTPLDLLDILEQGHVRTHAITLVEGWTLTQMRTYLAKDAHLQKLLSDVPNSELLKALSLDTESNRPPEGLFFPDTYVFSGATSDRDILRQSYRRMQEILEQEWQARAADLPYKNSYEALTMASIVERETGTASERPDIAGVFVRRLQRDMLLQTDPAVIYGLGEQFDGNLRRRDLDNADNPYNTYQHRGLPPTPIALPGRAAIHAALQPSAGDALYFVARGNGSHQFSATLDEHEKAVKKFQIEQRRANYSSRPQK